LDTWLCWLRPTPAEMALFLAGPNSLIRFMAMTLKQGHELPKISPFVFNNQNT
jgi:hypothetical protein